MTKPSPYLHRELWMLVIQAFLTVYPREQRQRKTMWEDVDRKKKWDDGTTVQ